jgi:hypothetical protein
MRPIIVRSEEGEVRSVKIVIRGFSAFPGETTGFVSGYRYLESARDLQTAIFHSSLLPPNFSLIKWVGDAVLL